MKTKIIATLVALSSAFVVAYVSTLNAKGTLQSLGIPDQGACKVSKDFLDCEKWVIGG